MLGLALATLATIGLVQDPPSTGPAADAPTLQRPKAPDEAHQDATVSPARDGAASEPASPDTPSAAAQPQPTSPTDEPAALPPSDAPAPAAEAPAPPDLLAPSEETQAEPPRRRTTNDDARGDLGISKEEAMRRYYAKLYRPADNPIRPIFGSRVGVAVLGSSAASLNGRVGTVEFEGGAGWNKFSFGLGGGVWFGTVNVDSLGETRSLFGATGALSLGLGRLGYTKRAILDPRLAYRATWMPLAKGSADAPEPEVAAMVPHGPEFRLDAAFMVSRSRQPRFFHAVGVVISMQAVVHTVGLDMPVYAVPRIGLVYSFS